MQSCWWYLAATVEHSDRVAARSLWPRQCVQADDAWYQPACETLRRWRWLRRGRRNTPPWNEWCNAPGNLARTPRSLAGRPSPRTRSRNEMEWTANCCPCTRPITSHTHARHQSINQSISQSINNQSGLSSKDYRYSSTREGWLMSTKQK